VMPQQRSSSDGFQQLAAGATSTRTGVVQAMLTCEPVWTCEPVSGFEPLTCRLQVGGGSQEVCQTAEGGVQDSTPASVRVQALGCTIGCTGVLVASS
jgi:hypothetical protein